MNATFRRSVRCLAGALLALAAGCDVRERAALAEGARADVTPTYLALGDSIAFGLDPHRVPDLGLACFSCGSFTSAVAPRSDNVFVGYPEYLQDRLGLPVENASCPGETSASLGAPAVLGQAAICATFKERGWLHESYAGAQQAFALDTLARHPRVELVTFQIGANDVLDLVGACGGEPACVNAGIGAVLASVHGNVTAALSAIRSAGYAGPIVVPTYYAPAPEWTQLVPALNYYLVLAATPFGATPVDLQALFGADPCGDGLLIPLDPLDPAAGCDIHPSKAGARLIADAIASAVAGP